MKTYTCATPEIHVYGLYQDDLPMQLRRLPRAVAEAVSVAVAERAAHAVGGRVRLRTDAPEVTVRVTLASSSADWAIPLSGSAGVPVYIGTRYAGLVCPTDYDTLVAEKMFEKAAEMEDITLFLPRNETVTGVEIILDDGATIAPPTPYTIQTPIVFYGSSITEGGCASRATNAYTALLSKWLDADYINLGFSGAAKGEMVLAEYIAGLTMSAFVYDYDHNAPTVAHLQATHAPFFAEIRRRQPTLPVLMLTRPDFDSNPADAAARRAVVRETYERAVQAGDQYVWFIDGQTLFGTEDRDACTIEGCHPNDLGFMRMAQVIYPVLRSMLL